MIPWFESTTVQLGPIAIRTWGTLVAAGFLFGGWVASRRAKAKSLDPNVIWDMAFWIFASAFVGARLFHAAFYEPEMFADWAALIDPTRPGFAILGGFLGAVTAAAVYLKLKKLDFLKFADVCVWGVAWGVAVGRLGCFMIHDHPGTPSTFILAVDYPGGPRHDLGFYLSLTGVAMSLVFRYLDRKPRADGFFLGAWLAMEASSRIWLDFYRIADSRWEGMTPTQWAYLPLLALGLFLVLKRGRKI